MNAALLSTLGALVFYNSHYFGQGSGPVLFTGLNCIGNEHKLEDCPSSSYPYYRSHTSDGGVKCIEKGFIQFFCNYYYIYCYSSKYLY